ncbi:hypothetical protein R1sor_000581 [Riccia sorocarpa]|uniref:Ricin B lectin domain-containing protein n=1 Tax=Riccia sorocarpa TaxID=122646 RepID=A0ABD3GW12_9MARC
MASRISACFLGLILLTTGTSLVRSEEFTAPRRPVKYRESYIVRYQNATCKDSGGKLVLLGPEDPIVLTGTGNFQVVTSTVGSGPKRSEQIWNQTLIEEPSSYTIKQSGDSIACMTVDADQEPSSILALDVCRTDSPTTQQFRYLLVRDNLPGCKKSNKNGWAVIIFPRAAFDIGNDICLSAPKTPGAQVTLEICDQRDENQLFFINVPSIRRSS